MKFLICLESLEKIHESRRSLLHPLTGKDQSGSGKLYIVQFDVHQLYTWVTGNHKDIVIKFDKIFLYLKQPQTDPNKIDLNQAPCLVVIHHWKHDGKRLKANDEKVETPEDNLVNELTETWKPLPGNSAVKVCDSHIGSIGKIFKLFEMKNNSKIKQIETQMLSRQSC